MLTLLGRIVPCGTMCTFPSHRGSETESEVSDLATVSDVEMAVDENDREYDQKPPKIGGKIKSE